MLVYGTQQVPLADGRISFSCPTGYREAAINPNLFGDDVTCPDTRLIGLAFDSTPFPGARGHQGDTKFMPCPLSRGFDRIVRNNES